MELPAGTKVTHTQTIIWIKACRCPLTNWPSDSTPPRCSRCGKQWTPEYV